VSTRIKICGCRSWQDASVAFEAGADAVGMIFAPSPSRIEWSAAAEIGRYAPVDATLVAVFANPSREDISRVRQILADPIIQLSGDEPPSFAREIGGRVIKAVHVGDESAAEIEDACDRYAPALPLLDTHVNGSYGGTGRRFDWSRIVAVARWRPLVVAGGLTPENVAICVREVKPFGVDVRSGVETEGRGDPAKVRRFVQAVRSSDAT
jgi:phosphoribosylanthranilate isomerase